MEISKMLRDELNIKYLSESRILRYLRNESSEEERFIVEKLRSNDINWENYALVKEMYEKGEFKESDKSAEKYKNNYKKFLEFVNKYHKPDPDFLVEAHKLNDITEPKAGQIWLTKAIPKLAYYEFDPVAFPKYVYILTNPQPYQPLDNQDEVKVYKEYFTMLVLPISIDTEYATHEDYIIESGNNILTVEFMIETWLETNMLVCNLEKCIGGLSPNQIDELLNVYFAANSMDYDKNIYNKAKKGKFHDKDYGDIYEFRRIEEDNIQYLYEPVEKLDAFFFVEGWYDELLNQPVSEKLNEPVYAQAAGDENVIPPSQQRVYAELILLADKKFELKLVVLDKGQLYIRLKSNIEKLKVSNNSIVIKDKITNEVLQKIDNIDLLKAIQYLHINKFLRDRLVEFSFFVDDRLYFLKNIDLRNVNRQGENKNGNSK